GVLDGFARDDVARLEVTLYGLQQHTGRLGRRIELFLVNVGHARRIRQAHAHGFEGGTHGVGRIHASAGARAGYGRTLDVFQAAVAQPAGGMFAHGFEYADDIQVAPAQAPRHDRAAIDIDGGHIGAQNAHHATGHVLVAAADDQHAVHPLALHAGFDAVGNDLARDKRILHAFGTHRHAV